MWRRIDPSSDDDLQAFYDIHKHVNDYYERKYTPDGLRDLFETKKDQDIRGYIYSANGCDMTLLVKKSPKREGVQILSCGTRSLGSSMKARAGVVHNKVKELMLEYGEIMAWGTWDAHDGANYPVGEAFFERFCRYCDNYGYSKTEMEFTKGLTSIRGMLRMYR